ncbi:MAG: type II toxin-antitoxin system RelE/ParE family toxin [Schwartzia sp.]|nr:type II toxin-antitoxin system RelE/ParE family toxin [Schwartzia sp. (in: firmicutes)]
MATTYAREAIKTMKSQNKSTRDRIKQAIDKLPEGDIVPLRGLENVYRLKVGVWRVVFEKIGDDIVIHRVRPRGQAYKRKGGAII